MRLFSVLGFAICVFACFNCTRGIDPYIGLPDNIILMEGETATIQMEMLNIKEDIPVYITLQGSSKLSPDQLQLLYHGKIIKDSFVLTKTYQNGDLLIKAKQNFTYNQVTALKLIFHIQKPTIEFKNNILSIEIIDNTLNQGLTARYLFNGNAKDSGPLSRVLDSNNPLNGIVYGASLTEDRFGRSDNAYFFDGINDYILVKDHDAFDFPTNQPYTVSLWVKPSLVQADITGTNNDIISKWNIDAEGYPYAFRIWNMTASEELRNKFFFLRYDGSSCDYALQVVDNNAFQDRWYHLVMMRTIDGIVKIYKDGNELYSAPDDAVCLTSNIDDLSIGRRHSYLRYFKGSIDDIMFYNRELSETEINRLYTAPPPNATYQDSPL